MPQPNLAEERGDYHAHYYAQLPEPLIDDPAVTVAELRVYAWLDRRAGARGWWHCSQREIAEALGIERRHVDRTIAVLLARGLLTVSAASYRVRCFGLPERTGISGSPTPRCAHAIGVPHTPISGSPTPRSTNRTLLDRKSPPKSPYAQTRARAERPAGPDPYRRLVHRVWPPDEQGTLGL